jgi:hypothetical protein
VQPVSLVADMMSMVGVDPHHEHRSNKSVQMQVKITDHQHGTDQNDADNHHRDIGVAWSGDEAR